LSDTPIVPENKIKGDPLLHNEWNAAAHIANVVNNLTGGNGLELLKSGVGMGIAQQITERMVLPGWTMKATNFEDEDIKPFEIAEIYGVPVNDVSNNRMFQDYRNVLIRGVTSALLDADDNTGRNWRGRCVALDQIPKNGGTGRVYIGGLCLTTVIVPEPEEGGNSLSNYDDDDEIWIGPAKFATIIKSDITDSTKFLTLSNQGEFEVLWVENTEEERRFAIVRFPAGNVGVLQEPYDLTYSDEHQEEARDTLTYENKDGVNVIFDFRELPEDADGFGLKITQSLGIAYYHDGDQKIYQYVADFHYNSLGQLVFIEEERRVEIEAPEDCS